MCSNPFTFFLVSGPLHHQCQSGWRAWLSSILQHHNNYACPVLEQFTRLSFVHGWRARLSSHPLIFEALYSSLQPFHFCLFLVSRPQPFIFEALYSSLQPFHLPVLWSLILVTSSIPLLPVSCVQATAFYLWSLILVTSTIPLLPVSCVQATASVPEWLACLACCSSLPIPPSECLHMPPQEAPWAQRYIHRVCFYF